MFQEVLINKTPIYAIITLHFSNNGIRYKYLQDNKVYKQMKTRTQVTEKLILKNVLKNLFTKNTIKLNFIKGCNFCCILQCVYITSHLIIKEQ